MFVFTCIFVVKDTLSYVFMPSIALFMRHFLPHCEVTSDGVMCVCLPVTVFVSLSVTEKSTFENINLVLSVISIITVPVKLL